MLEHVRFTAASEDDLQQGVYSVLETKHPLAFYREYPLSRRDRPDFFNPEDGIVIEAKWGPSGGSVAKVFGQLARYAEHESVKAIVFASPSRRVVSQLPEQIGGVSITGVVLTTWL